jgi:hypothetical protein
MHYNNLLYAFYLKVLNKMHIQIHVSILLSIILKLY